MTRPSDPIPRPKGPIGGPTLGALGPTGAYLGPAKSDLGPTHHVCPSALDALMMGAPLASVAAYLAAVLDVVAPIVGDVTHMTRLASTAPTMGPRGQ